MIGRLELVNFASISSPSLEIEVCMTDILSLMFGTCPGAAQSLHNVG